jgi:alpha-L-rhamnosidase
VAEKIQRSASVEIGIFGIKRCQGQDAYTRVPRRFAKRLLPPTLRDPQFSLKGEMMQRTSLRQSVSRGTMTIALLVFVLTGMASAETSKPTQLECDALVTPLGVDDKQPLLSWLLHDDRFGAKQTAYQIQIASQPDLLFADKPDVWDSGRVESEESVNVLYAGSALQPMTRYFWRVKIWDKERNPYPPSDVSWWETGLIEASNWHAQWITYEDEEQRRIREADAVWITNPEIDRFKEAGDTHHNFRFGFEVPKNFRRADLFVTGEDTAAAWINGKPVLEAQPLPPWKQPPWKTYSKKDITSQLVPGKNLLAADVIRYERKPGGEEENLSTTPMSATLFLEMKDGSVQVFQSGDQGGNRH